MSDFEDVKPYTQAELDQQAIWANEFDQWWENEGQYQRAGGGQYERTFAWWAWLNREQKQQAIIDEHTEVIKLQDADLRKYEKQIESLKEQLNNMETCYIEKKKEVEALQKTNISLEAGLRKNSKNKQKLLGKNIELQKRIDEALVIIEKHSRYIPFSAEQAIKEALRGAND
jgi:chromosome segregation ATPase